MIFKIVNFNDKPELEIHQSGAIPRKIRRDSRARYYKPLCLLVTLDAIEDGEISWNNIEPKIVINRFKYILENFDSGKSIEMGWMPFWHLSPLDKIWNCYKNGLISFIAGNNPTYVRFLLPISEMDKKHIDESFKIMEKSLKLCLKQN